MAKKEGDYKVVSDGTRINLNFSLRWLIGIAVPIIGFVGYLLIDKYYIVPMNSMEKVNASLVKKDSLKDITIRTLSDNMLIVLERTAKTQKDVDYIRTKINDIPTSVPVPIEISEGPGE